VRDDAVFRVEHFVFIEYGRGEAAAVANVCSARVYPVMLSRLARAMPPPEYPLVPVAIPGHPAAAGVIVQRVA
jgi:hypothetical protein